MRRIETGGSNASSRFFLFFADAKRRRTFWGVFKSQRSALQVTFFFGKFHFQTFFQSTLKMILVIKTGIHHPMARSAKKKIDLARSAEEKNSGSRQVVAACREHRGHAGGFLGHMLYRFLILSVERLPQLVQSIVALVSRIIIEVIIVIVFFTVFIFLGFGS
jgi:hypothetical protein